MGDYIGEPRRNRRGRRGLSPAAGNLSHCRAVISFWRRGVLKSREQIGPETLHRESFAEPASQSVSQQALPHPLQSLGNQATLRYLRRKCTCGGTCSSCNKSFHRVDYRQDDKGNRSDPILKINEPGDRFEREADAVAARVMRMPQAAPSASLAPGANHGLRLKCPQCEEKQQRHTLQRSGAAADHGIAPPIVHEVLRSTGQPLDGGVRSLMEPRFGHDFRPVRIHADAKAAESARAVDAQAYTLGRDIVFGEGRYAPGSSDGQWLLAHELSHVVQQSGSSMERVIRRQPNPTARGSRQPRSTGGSQTHGRVFFVQVDRTANTISFVTESGTLTYDLLIPTGVPVGSYSFAVSVQGNNLNLSAPAAVTSFSGFRYRIAAGQANPADLLRGQSQVSVMVIEGGNTLASSGSQPASTNAAAGSSILTVPVTYIAIPIDGPGTGYPGVPGISALTTGTGLGLHNLAFNDLSWLDSPVSSAYWESLLPRSGISLERSLVGLGTPRSALPSRLTPSLQTFLTEERPGRALTWLSRDRSPIHFQPDPASPLTRPFTAEELLSVDGLVRRYNANPASLTESELQLLREAARIHIGGSTPTAPFTSYSTPGQQVRWTGSRRYVVRVNVDRSAALDVSQSNAFNLGQDAITNAEEAEFLVVGDQSGRIISVQSVESLQSGGRSWIFENAGAIRWGGRLVIVAGLAYSGYRIATASPEERPRVVGEEAGGLGGGLAGGGLATAGCVAFGIATEGLGLLLCGLVGGFVGGAAGTYAGGEFLGGGWTQRWAQEAARREYEHFHELNPDATPADYDRLQQQQEDFDAWGLPGANW